MVMRRDEDLGNITRSYSDRVKHRDYDASASFPSDISHLLPPSQDRWWEHLGRLQLLRFSYSPTYNMKVMASRREQAAQQPPPPTPAPQRRNGRKLKLLLPPTPPRQSEEGGDVLMAVDEAPQVNPVVSNLVWINF
jgi:hypothetical protein